MSNYYMLIFGFSTWSTRTRYTQVGQVTWTALSPRELLAHHHHRHHHHVNLVRRTLQVLSGTVQNRHSLR